MLLKTYPFSLLAWLYWIILNKSLLASVTVAFDTFTTGFFCQYEDRQLLIVSQIVPAAWKWINFACYIILFAFVVFVIGALLILNVISDPLIGIRFGTPFLIFNILANTRAGVDEVVMVYIGFIILGTFIILCIAYILLMIRVLFALSLLTIAIPSSPTLSILLFCCASAC